MPCGTESAIWSTIGAASAAWKRAREMVIEEAALAPRAANGAPGVAATPAEASLVAPLAYLLRPLVEKIDRRSGLELLDFPGSDQSSFLFPQS